MQLVESFKYLGGIINSQANLQEEVDTCRVCGLGIFCAIFPCVAESPPLSADQGEGF
jgi:hypothetical protein